MPTPGITGISTTLSLSRSHGLQGAVEGWGTPPPPSPGLGQHLQALRESASMAPVVMMTISGGSTRLGVVGATLGDGAAQRPRCRGDLPPC